MQLIPDESVDLVVTSPPYDQIRDYEGFSFPFEAIASQLARIIKIGGVIVWIVGDQFIDGSQTLTSFRQSLYFRDILKLHMHDTMIYLKNSFSRPSSNRCHQVFEYMFILSKGKPKTFHPIRDRKVAYKRSGIASVRQKDGSLKHGKKGTKNSEFGGRFNVWQYKTGLNNSTPDREAFRHPAIFPEKLAMDHIYMWSNPHDIVIDPFNGSGTTTKMAYLMSRSYIGIDASPTYCEIARNRLAQYQHKQYTSTQIQNMYNLNKKKWAIDAFL